MLLNHAQVEFCTRMLALDPIGIQMFAFCFMAEKRPVQAQLVMPTLFGVGKLPVL